MSEKNWLEIIDRSNLFDGTAVVLYDELAKVTTQLVSMTDDRDNERKWANEYCNEVQELKAQLAEAEKIKGKLLKFFLKCTDPEQAGLDICGGDVQDWSVELGLLIEEVAKEDGEEWEVGDTIYKLAPELIAKEEVESE